MLNPITMPPTCKNVMIIKAYLYKIKHQNQKKNYYGVDIHK